MYPRKDSVRDYFGLAVKVVVRRHYWLLCEFHDDVIQELRLLAWEAEYKKRIHFYYRADKIKKYGNGRRMGVRSFSRAVQHAMYRFKKNYTGHY